MHWNETIKCKERWSASSSARLMYECKWEWLLNSWTFRAVSVQRSLMHHVPGRWTSQKHGSRYPLFKSNFEDKKNKMAIYGWFGASCICIQMVFPPRVMYSRWSLLLDKYTFPLTHHTSCAPLLAISDYKAVSQPDKTILVTTFPPRTKTKWWQ